MLAPDHGPVTADDENELRTKPRGFFADQFEVRIYLLTVHSRPSLTLTVEQEQLRRSLRWNWS